MERVHISSACYGEINNPDKAILPKQSGNFEVTYTRHISNDRHSNRKLALHPRMRSKIPKMLEWMFVDADYYIWMDSKFKIISDKFVEEMVKYLGDADICLHVHRNRANVQAEVNYMTALYDLNDPGILLRYEGEDFVEQWNTYCKDPIFHDIGLFEAGLFIYSKNLVKDKDNNLMKDWFFHNAVYTLQDQISLPFVLQKHKVKYNRFPFDVYSSPYVAYSYNF